MKLYSCNIICISALFEKTQLWTEQKLNTKPAVQYYIIRKLKLEIIHVQCFLNNLIER